MTITQNVTSITPCPVDWCPAAGHHEWDVSHTATGNEYERQHALPVLDFISDTGEVERLVAVCCDETADGAQTTVDLFGRYSQLLDRDEADQLVDAIQRAADLAFGPVLDTYSPERAELDAAVAEVAMRADHPQDVNRLIAAAIRLREAYAVLSAVTR